MVDYRAIGRRIAKIRKSKKLTQGALAEQCELSTGYISRIEQGRTKISLPRLSQFAELLEVDISFLVSDGIRREGSSPSEIEQLTENWTSSEKEMLLAFINLYNNKKKSN